MKWEDESIHWIRTHGKFVFDADGKPVRLIGASIDITDAKQEEMRKNDFLAIASHELKTPLTSLKLMIDILNGEAGQLDDRRPELLRKANRQINKMTTLIHNFLDLSRIESGRLTLYARQADLNEVIQRVVEENRAVIQGGTIHFSPGLIPSLVIDAEKVGQVIENLVNNAIKYSVSNPVITIATSLADQEVIVSVKDEGIGIDQADVERIFERFYRVEDNSANGSSGFGIGLYLSADIVQRHGGWIRVESSKGAGSTFMFSLPVPLDTHQTGATQTNGFLPHG